MAQLSDDCFAAGLPPTHVDDALAHIAAHVAPVARTQAIALDDADGRVLAASVVATIDLPPFENSAVDGYAVRHADLASSSPSSLRVVGRFAAGDPTGVLQPGTAARVFTGAPVPQGADTVFMQEDVTLSDGLAMLPAGLRPGANTRPRGEDVADGDVALPSGRRLRPADLALAAALGVTRVFVRRRLRVAIASTGNEVTRPGAVLSPGHLYDSNRILLASLVRRAGGSVTDLGILADDRAATAAALHEAAGMHDLVLTSGGVSTGEEDHVRAALEQAGQLTLWRLGIKPGRPVAMGVLRGAAFAGLPGNPVAVFVTFVVLVRPLLARLAGESYVAPRKLPVASGFAYRKKAGRREFIRVRLDDALVAHKHPQDGAGILTSLTESDGMVELPEDMERLAEGEPVGFVPFSGWV